MRSGKIKRVTFRIGVLICLLILQLNIQLKAASSYGFQDKPLVNPDPSPEAAALFHYLQDMSGKKILSGQMWAPWGINEIDYVFETTGRYPALAGFDLINEYQNDGELQKAKNWWLDGGITTVMWHWGAPGIGEGYENSKKQIDINRCFQEGTEENTAMWAELEKKADHLQLLRDANVPVLWRPFHEFNGGWFWWGMQGPELFKQLWVTMYDYFVNDRGLNNLIWVLCYADPPNGDWYPGDEYVDIAGSDTYSGGIGSHQAMYNSVKQIIAHNPMPITYHECGVPPDPAQCIDKEAYWSWWMQWHTGHLTDTDPDYLSEVYNHELIITKDELPDIVEVYSWSNECVADSIVLNTRIDGGNWGNERKVMVRPGSSVLLSPQTEGSGTWSWTGCGLSGTDMEQTISRDSECTATVAFTNSCGALSTEVFHVSGECIATIVTPYLQVWNDVWKLSDTITLDSSMLVTLAPQPATGGDWSWVGPGLASNSRIVDIVPDTTSFYIATFTNSCGAESSIEFVLTVQEIGNDVLNIPYASLKIFPTVVENELNVSLPEGYFDGTIRIKIMTSGGRIIFDNIYNEPELVIDTSHYPEGIYMVMAGSSGNTFLGRFICI